VREIENDEEDGNHERERVVFDATVADNCVGGVVLEIQYEPLDVSFFFFGVFFF